MLVHRGERKKERPVAPVKKMTEGKKKDGKEAEEGGGLSPDTKCPVTKRAKGGVFPSKKKKKEKRGVFYKTDNARR